MVLLCLTCEGHLEAVMVIHHGGDAVKAEPIKLVLVHPPSSIGHQEPQRLPVACVAGATLLHLVQQICTFYSLTCKQVGTKYEAHKCSHMLAL